METAYDLSGDDAVWRDRIVELLRPLMDAGEGLVAYFYDVSLPPATWFDAAATKHASRAYNDAMAEFHRTASAPSVAEFVNRIHVATPLFAGLEEVADALGVPPRDRTIFRSHFRAHGFDDVLGLRTSDGTGRGLSISAASRTPISLRDDRRWLWSRVSTHLAAGLRLRRGLASEGVTEGAEAVLTPSGRVEHAEGIAKSSAAREWLREAVVRQEEARRASPDEAAEALELWRGLEHGRWSLVDHFERGGRRYIVARRNEPNVEDPRALTLRERQIARLVALGHSNKLIAYELGLATSTVAGHLAMAMRKLRIPNRVSLIRMFRP